MISTRLRGCVWRCPPISRVHGAFLRDNLGLCRHPHQCTQLQERRLAWPFAPFPFRYKKTRPRRRTRTPRGDDTRARDPSMHTNTCARTVMAVVPPRSSCHALGRDRNSESTIGERPSPLPQRFEEVGHTAVGRPLRGARAAPRITRTRLWKAHKTLSATRSGRCGFPNVNEA